MSQGTRARSVQAWLSAIEGMPSIIPVIAPPTVPENTVSIPRLAPRLTPDSSSCGGSRAIRWLSAMTAQSPGVPVTAQRRGPRSLMRIG